MAAISRLLKLLLPLLQAILSTSQESTEFTKEAALKLLQTSLSSPNANDILADTKNLLRHVFDTETVETMVKNVTSSGAGVSSCPNAEPALEIPKYADRHVRRINEVRTDFDCMHREFDVASEEYNYKAASSVLAKCRIVVLRNVYQPDMIQQYRTNFSNYVSDLHYGNIRRKGKTNHGEGGFVVERAEKRWEVLMPKYLSNKHVVINKNVLKIIKRKKVLGKGVIVHSLGGIIAEAKATAGPYHYDDDYIYEENSLEDSGVAGHDLPPWAITMMTPLMSNMTYDHGPTEFCVGTSHFRGLDGAEDPLVWDNSLLNDDYAELLKFAHTDKYCPPQFHRVFTLQLGDAVLFDYQITHRGGANSSPDLRSMLYVTYARQWYRDSNFNSDFFGKKMTKLDKMTQSTRFAKVKELQHDCDKPPCPERTKLESIRNFMSADNTPEEDDDDEEDMDKKKKFWVSNVDVDNASLWFGKTLLDGVAIGKSVSVKIPIGETLVLMKGDDRVKSWRIRREQEQIVISNKLLHLNVRSEN